MKLIATLFLVAMMLAVGALLCATAVNLIALYR